MIAQTLFWASLVVLVMVFVAYPVSLMVLGAAGRQRRRRAVDGARPAVTLVISAYNEQAVIARKIENSLALRYRRDRLEIVVVSDASTDATDEICAAYAERGVRVLRTPVRSGKSIGLNAAVAHARGEIVVFSDANAFYAEDAIEKLVRNFSDERVGCVTGDSRYVGVAEARMGRSEDTYWRYEQRLKMAESDCLGGIVGADGAIFAIRKGLYIPLRADDINDFVTPLKIVEMGYHSIFEPEARCYEALTVHLRQEFRRKVRIVTRSWNALRRVPGVLNPLRSGVFSVQLMVHKVLRWLTPGFLLILLGSTIALAPGSRFYSAALLVQLLVYGLGLVGLLGERAGFDAPVLRFASYFLVVNAASAIGIAKGLLGQRIDTREPERKIELPVGHRSR